MSSLKDFEVITKLGEGSFGQVFKVKRKIDKQLYVMKQINISKMNDRMKREALNEATILSRLDSQFIVKYYDSFIDHNVLCIVMEFCEQGDLHRYLKSQMGRPLSEPVVWRFLIQMCLGLTFMHKMKILHRDIKSMNIFLCKENQIRIGDLGVAKVLSDQNNFARTMVGTPYYLSPEMCEERPYNEKSDIWALGCVLYELCTFKHPFEANNQGALVLKIIRGKQIFRCIFYKDMKLLTLNIIHKISFSLLIYVYRRTIKSDPMLWISYNNKHQFKMQSKEIKAKNFSIKLNQRQLQLSLNLFQPHPQSKQFKQEPKPEVVSQAPEKTKPQQASVIQLQPQFEPKQLVVKGTSQQLLVAQKPVPIPQVSPSVIISPQPIRKEPITYVTPKVVIKSTAFQNAKIISPQPISQQQIIQVQIPVQIQNDKAYPQPSIFQQPQQIQSVQIPYQSVDIQNMYSGWKDKALDLHKKDAQQQKQKNQPIQQSIQVSQVQAPQPISQDQIRTVNKQVIQPSKKPSKVQSIKQTPQPAPTKLIEAPEKKRVRKGAPKDQARKVSQVVKKPTHLNNDEESIEARSKLKLLKNKRDRDNGISQSDVDEVINLPDRVFKKSKESFQIETNQQEVDVDDFFFKNNQKGNSYNMQDEQNIEEMDEYNSEPEKQNEKNEYKDDKVDNENIIPFVESNYAEDSFDNNNQIQQDEQECELILFDDDTDDEKIKQIVNQREIEEETDQYNSDQENYYDNENEFEQENPELQYEEQIDETILYNEDETETSHQETNLNKGKFNTIREDPLEDRMEDTKLDQNNDEQFEIEQTQKFNEQQIDPTKLRLNKQLLEKEKRKMELEMLMQAKIRECVRELGQKKFSEIIDFFRKKLNSDAELNEKDQEEIDDIVQNKFLNQKNPQIIYQVYKILHFEIEIDKCNDNVSQLQRQLSLQ